MRRDDALAVLRGHVGDLTRFGVKSLALLGGLGAQLGSQVNLLDVLGAQIASPAPAAS